MDKQLFAAFLIHNKKNFSGKVFSESVSIALKDARNDRIVTGALALSFIEFFRDECEPFLDSFFDPSLVEKKTVMQSFQKRGIVQHVFGEFLLRNNTREIQRMLGNLYKRFESNKPLVTIRSPQELSQKTKRHIRDFYKSGVVFEIDTQLVGGLIVYRGGVITDKSFSAILSRIPSLSS